MLIKGYKIEKRLDIKEFLDLISDYKAQDIICTYHTFFRLSEAQRKVFKCDSLKDYILYEIPIFVGLQYNKNYAVFYKHKKEGIIRIILNIKVNKIEIVTFYIINEKQIPRV